MGAVAAADVTVAVRTLVLGNHESVAGVGGAVGVLGAEQCHVVLDAVGEVRLGRVAAGVDDADRDALAGEALSAHRGGAHRVRGLGVEELDPLVGVDVVRDPGGHRCPQCWQRALHERQRQLVHGLHGQAQPLQR